MFAFRVFVLCCFPMRWETQWPERLQAIVLWFVVWLLVFGDAHVSWGGAAVAAGRVLPAASGPEVQVCGCVGGGGTCVVWGRVTRDAQACRVAGYLATSFSEAVACVFLYNKFAEGKTAVKWMVEMEARGRDDAALKCKQCQLCGQQHTWAVQGSRSCCLRRTACSQCCSCTCRPIPATTIL